MLVGAIGCNLAWGIVDAIMYVMNSLAGRGRNLLAFRALRDAASPAQARTVLTGALPPVVAQVMAEEELDAMRRRLPALPEPRRQASLSRGDLLSALAVFLLVFFRRSPS